MSINLLLLFDYITDRPYKMADKVEIKASKQAKKQLKSRNVKWYLYPIAYPVALFTRQAHPYFYTKNGRVVSITQKKLNRPKQVKNKFNGETFLLTSAYTFSSASMLAVGYKCYQMGTIVGEETGEPLMAYGDVIDFELPNTKLKAYSSHKKFTHPCYDGNSNGVIPDIKIEQTIKDIESSRDPVIDYIISRIEKK